jgi:hypothetical protein
MMSSEKSSLGHYVMRKEHLAGRLDRLYRLDAMTESRAATGDRGIVQNPYAKLADDGSALTKRILICPRL